jgi:FMN phosphatase YigB (HAD superfamily)
VQLDKTLRGDVDAEGSRRAGLTGIWLDRSHTRTSLHRDPVNSTLEDLA